MEEVVGEKVDCRVGEDIVVDSVVVKLVDVVVGGDIDIVVGENNVC